ncbi:efflux RND transporter periplasmic adaptor subunit [Corynebacterium sp. CCUG 69979]|uniref:efflux RND transporter periplasmic adaptor subunit n=1 Tax=Corynebacterium sp. CCUG 69979 TaxID=2823890 RepID=UPI002108A145|nr:efflux RND transporter periplasmic adaptor subunit [Corynebacterium sp. CCUG 69979]MCQ4624617.1 efflux RND transporter periplasmic adaptor subunit [Corynebacterium sp. CCUG 69979]
MTLSSFRTARKTGASLAAASTLFFVSACGMGGGGDAASGDLGSGDYQVVAKEGVVNSIVVDGSVAPIKQAGISSAMAAPVEKIHVQLGDKVKKGQLLVTMDTSAGPQLQSQGAGAEALEMDAAGSLHETLLDAGSAIEDCLKPLLPGHPKPGKPCAPPPPPQGQPAQPSNSGPSREEIERALGEAHAQGREQGQREAQQAIEQQMMDAQGAPGAPGAPGVPGPGMGDPAADPATQEMLMQQQAQAQAEESIQEYETPDPEIYAPMDGVVTKIEAEEGSPAAGGLMTVSDTSRFLVRANVRESDVANVREGNRVTFTTPVTDDKEFEGRVRRVAPMADGDPAGAGAEAAARAMQGQGGDKKDTGVTFPVEIEVTGDTKDLRLGASARVEIITDESPDGLSIPRDAVFDGNKVLVLARENEDATTGKIEERTVETGVKNDTDIAVTGGDLKEGDTVIAWPDDYRDRIGEEVTIADDTSADKSGDKPADKSAQE